MLLSTLARIDMLVSPARSHAHDLADPAHPTDSTRSELVGLMHDLIRGLQVHFQAERESLDSDFDDAPALRAAFLNLDEDHPRILDAFHTALDALEDKVTWGRALSLTRGAVAALLEHEAREEALFRAHG